VNKDNKITTRSASLPPINKTIKRQWKQLDSYIDTKPITIEEMDDIYVWNLLIFRYTVCGWLSNKEDQSRLKRDQGRLVAEIRRLYKSEEGKEVMEWWNALVKFHKAV
jgi:hypothetical protein